MANTTNYNWETPDDTDLVKDGAAAIRTLGSSIDTTTKNLNPETTLGDIAYRSATANTNTRLAIGTTGQVLTVAGGVPTWATSDDANAIQNAIVDAKGDIVAASAADTPARLAVGTDNQRLVAASGETTGLKYVSDTQNTVIDAEGDLLVGDAADALQRLAIGSNDQVLTVDTSVDGKIKWAAPASGGGYTSLATGSLSGTTTTVNITTTGYKEVRIFIKNLTAAADYNMDVRLNGDSGNNYNFVGAYMSAATTFASQARSASDAFFADAYEATANGYFCFTIFDPANTDAHKIFAGIFTGKNIGNTYNDAGFAQGRYMSNSAITSVSFVTGASASTGTYEIYGVK